MISYLMLRIIRLKILKTRRMLEHKIMYGRMVIVRTIMNYENTNDAKDG